MGTTNHKLWGIVLAGGEGERLRPFVREHLGTDRPKQFCTFLGGRTMIEHTLHRAAAIIPRKQLLVVSTAHQSEYLFNCLGPVQPGTVLLQPTARGTAPAVLLSLAHVMHKDPHAVVAVLPSDQFIRPGERFMRAVAETAVYLANAEQDLVAVLAVEPTDPESDYGWLQPGARVVDSRRLLLRHVTRFIEKPPNDLATALMAEGWLWNTMVLVARASALFELIRRAAPGLARAFTAVQANLGMPSESLVLDEIYRAIPPVNLSTTVLTRNAERLLVLPVRKVLWSDWGRGERILATLTELGILPPAPVEKSVDSDPSPVAAMNA